MQNKRQKLSPRRPRSAHNVKSSPAKAYFSKIRQKFETSVIGVISRANKTQLNSRHELTPCKTLIRSHVDYKVPVAHYKDEEIKKR